MRSAISGSFAVMALGIVLAGCAGDGTNVLTTGTVPQQKKLAVAPVDPACLALQNRIRLLQQEGTIGRVEKAAAGRTKTVVIKRASLSKVAEFNQANAEFRSRCSKLPRTAAVAPPAAVTAAQLAAAGAQKAATTARAGQTAATQGRAIAAALKKQ